MQKFVHFIIFCFLTVYSLAAEGFWSRATYIDKQFFSKTTGEQVEIYFQETNVKDVISRDVEKNRKFKTANEHIDGLFNAVARMPANPEKLDGIMEEVAGLIFHSTPLSSPISEEEPEFEKLKDLDPQKLDESNAYYFREATEDDADTLDKMVFLAGILGAYLVEKHKSIDAQWLIDNLHLNTANLEVVGDYEGYLEHVAHFLRFIEMGMGRNLDWFGTLYGDEKTSDEILEYYNAEADAGKEFYNKLPEYIKKFKFESSYLDTISQFNMRISKHDPDAMLKADNDDRFEYVTPLRKAYEKIANDMGSFTWLFETDPGDPNADMDVMLKKTDQARQDSTRTIANIKKTLLTVSNLSDFDKGDEAGPSSDQWQIEKDLLEKAKKAIEGLEEYFYLGNAFKIANEIVTNPKLKKMITPKDVMDNLQSVARGYGGLGNALKAIPNLQAKLTIYYEAIIEAVHNPRNSKKNSKARANERIASVIELDAYSYGHQKDYNFIFNNYIGNFTFILPRFLYEHNFDLLKIKGAWLPELEKENDLKAKCRTLSMTEVKGKTVNINSLPNCWRHLVNVQFLGIQGFGDGSGIIIEELPEDMKLLTKLDFLKLNKVGLKKIPDSIKHLKLLRELHMRSNPISDKITIDQVMQKFPNLEKVALKDYPF